ncbi:hypothetical protein SV7mr_14410 [Stieleria bergensis]|uniref:ABC transmembrane type-1 domain-containing protein n=2 Tax=Stieleria bergensis TaxID=2528025 RepID=A0A517SS51_9BACT|nr:hypothetical protein SV7mr_14410 [Planctomycetes bacterium SV_7m_r]
MIWPSAFLVTVQFMFLCALLSAAIGLPQAMMLWMLSQQRGVGRGQRLAGWGLSYSLLAAIACLATPLILHAAAWEATAGKFGWTTFTQTGARDYSGWGGQYGGMVAALWVHGLFGSQIVALLTFYGVRRVPQEISEQAAFDGGLLWRWWRVLLPIAMPWACLGVLASAMLAATEMTVVDLYGVRTLADEFYLVHAAQPSLASITMLLVLPVTLLIVAACLMLLRGRRVTSSLQGFVGQWSHSTERPHLANEVHRQSVPPLSAAHRGDSVSVAPLSRFAHLAVLCGAVLMASISFTVPFLGLLVKAGQEVSVRAAPVNGDKRLASDEMNIAANEFSPNVSFQPQATAQPIVEVTWSAALCWQRLRGGLSDYWPEYQWSVLIGLAAAAFCVPIAWLMAAWTADRPRCQLAIRCLTLLLFLIPGPLVGMVVVQWFNLSLPGFRTLYQETLIPTILGLSVRGIPLAYWILAAGYASLDGNVRELLRSGGSRVARFWWGDLRLLSKPLLIAVFVTAVATSGDVPVLKPVIPPSVPTVGIRLFGLLHSGVRDGEATLAFWYIGSIVMMGILVVRVVRGRWS